VVKIFSGKSTKNIVYFFFKSIAKDRLKEKNIFLLHDSLSRNVIKKIQYLWSNLLKYRTTKETQWYYCFNSYVSVPSSPLEDNLKKRNCNVIFGTIDVKLYVIINRETCTGEIIRRTILHTYEHDGIVFVSILIKITDFHVHFSPFIV